MARLEGKVALVTGGARGMGAAFARAMVAEGARVVVSDILVDEGRAVAAELGAAGAFCEHDVVRSSDWSRTVAAVERTFGPITVLVNNAAIASVGSVETVTEAEFRHVIDVDLISVFLGMNAVVPSMRRAGGGSIVNVSSMAAMVAWPGNISYVAAKWGVRGMTKAAALDLAPQSIRVNSLHPGIVATAMTADIPDTHPMVTGLPLSRKAHPAELAHLVVFLASDEASYCTGAEFLADGGYTAS